MRTLTPDEARRFLRVAREDRLEALYVLAITTGMRQGELLGLRWRDVDLESHTIRVTGSLQYISGQGLEISEPKTARSRRKIMLGQLAVTALQRLRIAQDAARNRSGSQWAERGLVFTNRTGGPLYATNLIGRSFRKLLIRAGVPRVRFHDLRHSTATLLLGEGIHPKLVSEMLGHSTVTMTLDLYSHATPTMHSAATAALDQLLSATDG